MTTRQNTKVRDFVLDALLQIPNDNIEVLSIFENKLKDIAQFLKEKDPILYAELIRYMTPSNPNIKTAFELRKQKILVT